MKLWIALSLALAAPLATACIAPAYNYQPTVRNISEPPLNQVSTASIGDNMLRLGSYAEHDGIRLDREIIVGSTGDAKIAAGDYLKVGEKEGDQFFAQQRPLSMPTKTSSEMPQSVMLRKGGEICLIDRGYGYHCAQGAHLKFTKTLHPADQGFEQILLYNGRVGDRIKIGYREFSSGVARPAFSNEAEYDLSASTTIAYKGAIIEVLEASNEQIRFRVKRSFQDN